MKPYKHSLIKYDKNKYIGPLTPIYYLSNYVQKKDIYDRYLAICYDGDKNINYEMVKNGMAIKVLQQSPSKFCVYLTGSLIILLSNSLAHRINDMFI